MTTRIACILLFFLVLSVSVSRCGKNLDANANVEDSPHTTYEMHCLSTAWRPEPVPWPSPTPEPPVPEKLSRTMLPIEIQHCTGLNGQPRFFQNEMPGLTAVVDCNDHIVRFRTRDFSSGEMNWQLNERAQISPSGALDTKIMYITRLAEDAAGTQNCWVRLLGHIQGTVDCPADPTQARFSFTATWMFDETPPEVMEAPAPGNADIRNGPHCRIKQGNCLFTNSGTASCNGT